jgi:GNAT superfamily N-acetyltransferase
LATTTLKTGEELEIGVIRAPEREYADQIQKFLDHKPDCFKRHIDLCLAGPLDELETRFYVGLLEGQVISQVMIVEYAGVGILGHVFTRPEHRQKGAYRAVMAQQMEDFRQRGSEFLLLGTGFESPPYWIYHSFGFRSVTGDSGFMRYAASEDFEARWFAPAPAQVVDVKWRHWPMLNALFGQKEGDFLRSVALGLFGPRNFEGGFLTFREALEERASHQAKLLETEAGAVVGCATVWPDPRWPGTYLLDVFVHPNFAAEMSPLLAALAPVEAKTLAYAEASATARNAALEKAGFRQEGTLTQQLRQPDGRVEEVVVWGR